MKKKDIVLTKKYEYHISVLLDDSNLYQIDENLSVHSMKDVGKSIEEYNAFVSVFAHPDYNTAAKIAEDYMRNYSHIEEDENTTHMIFIDRCEIIGNKTSLPKMVLYATLNRKNRSDKYELMHHEYYGNGWIASPSMIKERQIIGGPTYKEVPDSELDEFTRRKIFAERALNEYTKKGWDIHSAEVRSKIFKKVEKEMARFEKQ